MARRVETKHKDFSRIPHAVIDSGLLGILKPGELKVFLVINRHADYDTGIAFPTYATIRKLSSLGNGTIAKAIEGLVTKGLMEKKRVSKRFSFRNVYRVREPGIAELKSIICIFPKKTDKSRRILRGRDGKFKPVAKNTDNDIPQNTDNEIPKNRESDTLPKNTDKKKTLETKKRFKVLETAGSASARPKGQASPASNSKKSLKTFSKETINGFIKDKGLPWLEDYLRRNGYDEKEIENLREAEGDEDD